MLSEESEPDVEESFVFRTFDEDEYESPAESDDDEDLLGRPKIVTKKTRGQMGSMETLVTSYWITLNFRCVLKQGTRGKRREHIPLAEG